MSHDFAPINKPQNVIGARIHDFGYVMSLGELSGDEVVKLRQVEEAAVTATTQFLMEALFPLPNRGS
jgi:hypothetical protein